jgi:hypothetical protein
MGFHLAAVTFMTVEQYLTNYLQENFLMPDEASAIMQEFKVLDLNKAVHWTSPKEGYPDVLYPSLLLSLNLVARKWLARNSPEHFAIAMFMSESEAEAFFDGK